MPFFSVFLTRADADEDESAHGGTADTNGGHPAAEAEMHAAHVARRAIPDRPAYLCRCSAGIGDPPGDWRMSARAIAALRGGGAAPATPPFVMETAALAAGTASPSLATTNILIFRCGYNRRGEHDVINAFRLEAYRFACFCVNRLPALAPGAVTSPDPYVVVVNNGHNDEHPPRSIREQVLEALRRRTAASAPRLKLVAFFGHGEPFWMQFGFTVPNTASSSPGTNTLGDLVTAMQAACDTDVRVVIYGCSAGATPGTNHDGTAGDNSGIDGLADLLRDALRTAGLTGCRVDAHASVAHTTTNPRVRRFLGADSTRGGHWIVPPTNAPRGPDVSDEQRMMRDLWLRWVDAVLRNPTEMRFLFPFLDDIEVWDWLRVPGNFSEHSPFRTAPAPP